MINNNKHFILTLSLFSSLLLSACDGTDLGNNSSQPANPSACTINPDRLDLNDVSFLFPLPNNEEERAALLGLKSPGLGGTLANEEQTSTTEPVALAGTTFPDFKVLAARIDPCAPTELEGECARELRLVLQPVGLPGESYPTDIITGEFFEPKTYIGIDRAMHMIYAIEEEQFGELVNELRKIKTLAGSTTTCKSLSVNPVMAEEGLLGPYTTAVNAMIQKFAGEANLSRTATTSNNVSLWIFKEFLSPFTTDDQIEIPGVSDPSEKLQGIAVFDGEFVNFGNAPPTRFSEVGQRFDGAVEALGFIDRRPIDQEAINLALRRTFAVDNPELTHVKNTDCGTCHFTERLRKVRIDDPRIMVDPSIYEDEYLNPSFDLAATADGFELKSVRMFGYMNEKPAIGQRVVNESANVAEMLEAF